MAKFSLIHVIPVYDKEDYEDDLDLLFDIINTGTVMGYDRMFINVAGIDYMRNEHMFIPQDIWDSTDPVFEIPKYYLR